MNTPPKQVALTYSEAVEPRFAIVSVTDAAATSETTGPPRRSPSDPDTLVVPLKHLRAGLVPRLLAGRSPSTAIPVRGAFTFAVGPNPGPAPQFVIPSISETAATPRCSWRALDRLPLRDDGDRARSRFGSRSARPVVRRVPGSRCERVSIAFCVARAVGARRDPGLPRCSRPPTSRCARSSRLGALVPLVRASAFGRGYLDLGSASRSSSPPAASRSRSTDPSGTQRSIAELLALDRRRARRRRRAARARPRRPRRTDVAARPLGLLDWLHLAAGSLWIGGLVGLLVLWRSLPAARRVAGLVVAVPRFSNVAFVSVLVLIGSGTGRAVLHLPTLAIALADLVRPGAPRQDRLARRRAAARRRQSAPRRSRGSARRRSRDAGAAATPAAPPRRAARPTRRGGDLRRRRPLVPAAAVEGARRGRRRRRARRPGPGRPAPSTKNGYTFDFRVTPNKAAVPNAFAVTITRNGQPVPAPTSSPPSRCSTWRWAIRPTASPRRARASTATPRPRS